MYSIRRERRRGGEGSLTGEQEQEGLLQRLYTPSLIWRSIMVRKRCEGAIDKLWRAVRRQEERKAVDKL